ncbi:MAG: hypothetical protein RLZZ70_814 [Candidatus Parcubacteria bacterium]|jgi:hypothetical protein
MEPNQPPVAPEVTEVKYTAPSAKWYSSLCRVTKTSKLLAALTMIILPFVGGYVGWEVANTKPVSEFDAKFNKNEYVSSTTVVSHDVNNDSKTRELFSILNNPKSAIFAINKSTVRSRSGSKAQTHWEIYKKNENKIPSLIAVIKHDDGAGYYSEFELNHDNSMLAINTGLHIYLVDIETGEVNPIHKLTSSMYPSGMSFSPDGTQLAFVDGTKSNSSLREEASLYAIDILSKEINFLTVGGWTEQFDTRFESVEDWKTDGTIVLSYIRDTACALPEIKIFDFDTMTINPTPKFIPRRYDVLSSSSSSPLVCEQLKQFEMCQNQAFEYETQLILGNREDGKVWGYIGDGTESVSVVAINKDNTEVLYSSHVLPENTEQCYGNYETKYFHKKLLSGETTSVSDIGVILQEWNISLISPSPDVKVLTNYFYLPAVVNR